MSKKHYSAFRYDDETARQIAFLAARWGQEEANVSSIVTRCIERVYQQEADMNDLTTGFDAKHLSREAQAACKALHFTPRRFEVLNADRPTTWDGGEEYPVLRIWNSRREVILTNRDLAEAATYLA